jgi:hypothetical protein
VLSESFKNNAQGFIQALLLTPFLEKKIQFCDARITLFRGIPRTKACENDYFVVFFSFRWGKIQFKNSIQD